MKPSRLFLAAVVGLAAALVSIPGGGAAAQTAEMDRLRMQLRDCSGPSCVAQRNQLIAQLRHRARDCSGAACEPLRMELHDQQRLRDCDRSGDACAALRQQVRQHAPQMGPMHNQNGPGGGMRGGMGGGGMGGGGMGGGGGGGGHR